MYDQATLDRNGGHSPECEGSCAPSCPIGQERRADADGRAAGAQRLFDRANGHYFQPDAANRTRCDICGRGPRTAAHERGGR